jgi:toxin-antitoxin system PIN domain toxin
LSTRPKKTSRVTRGVAREPSAAYLTESPESTVPVRFLLDVNVLIALLDADHLHHRRASDWLADNLALGWASCATTQNACIRLMSHPAYPNALPAARVAERLRAAASTAHHRFVTEALSLLDTERFDAERLLGHRSVTAAFLLGLAVQNDLRLVTFDATLPLQAVRGATLSHIVTL